MAQNLTLTEKDHQYVWHPCSQMKDYETFKPLEIQRAEGCYFYLKDGSKVIDAISSWWCKSLGHQDPRVKAALQQQINQFDHVILANTTNDIIVALSEKLAQLSPNLSKVSYASDGSSAVEMALKMSLHVRKIQGNQQRRQFIALENGYHGETTGAMSVSDLGLYSTPYRDMLFATTIITQLPYVQNSDDLLWHNCELHWQHIEKQLAPLADTATAIILEPIVQGAGGMKIYSQDFLRQLRAWTSAHDIHLIADECMTGLGRTGKLLACHHANIEPDFLVLSKGITAGWLPMSVMLTSQAIYDHFYDDYATGKSFLHSHTHSGNVLAARVALEVLQILEQDNLCARANQLGTIMQKNMQAICDETNLITNVRSIGAITAADLINPDAHPRLGFAVFQKAVALGALLRPLGNTIYWLPPLTATTEILDSLKEITQQAVQNNYDKKS